MAVSNNITTPLNFIALMCLIPIISAGIWQTSKLDNECIQWHWWPLVFLGLAFFLVTLSLLEEGGPPRPLPRLHVHAHRPPRPRLCRHMPRRSLCRPRRLLRLP
ncbi:tetraspanin2 [Perilla frutescens var. hirtella]|nr:tetraspanin2 [Perilla frutescens var. hirtella]